jgi:hypothetical protein
MLTTIETMAGLTHVEKISSCGFTRDSLFSPPELSSHGEYLP